MNEYLLTKLIQLSKQNTAYKKIDYSFEIQTTHQLERKQYIIKLNYRLTHDDVTSQAKVKPNEYINEFETAILLWCKIHGLKPSFKRTGSSVDLISKDGAITYTVEYNLMNI